MGVFGIITSARGGVTSAFAAIPSGLRAIPSAWGLRACGAGGIHLAVCESLLVAEREEARGDC